jgi:hypothetical protein
MPPLLTAKITPFLFSVACTPANTHFLFLPPWWEYLKGGTIDALGQCAPNFTFPGDVWSVGLAILDMLLRIAGFAAVVSIIIAGFQHQFTMGDPQKAATARRRIYNSLIGLAIALIATALVTFIGNQLAK